MDIRANFSAMAKEIVELLDSKESSEKTRGDGKIEGSIWGQYSGKAGSDNISVDDAEKVVMVDLQQRGVDFIRGVLHSLGIEWEPKQGDSMLDVGVLRESKKPVEAIQRKFPGLKDTEFFKKEVEYLKKLFDEQKQLVEKIGSSTPEEAKRIADLLLNPVTQMKETAKLIQQAPDIQQVPGLEDAAKNMLDPLSVMETTINTIKAIQDPNKENAMQLAKNLVDPFRAIDTSIDAFKKASSLINE